MIGTEKGGRSSGNPMFQSSDRHAPTAIQPCVDAAQKARIIVLRGIVCYSVEVLL